MRKDGRIDLVGLEALIAKYATNKGAPTLAGTFQVMANRAKKMSGGKSLNDFFESRMDWTYHHKIEFADYMTQMVKVLLLTKDEVRETYQALDTGAGFIACNELVFTLNTYVMQAQVPDLDILSLDDVLPGYTKDKKGLKMLADHLDEKLEENQMTLAMVW